ncbi:MAG: S8 family serine peptidase, partial [Anaerolineae bacterium]|nr:S8 family serine peptidase [Anaerolineae bacterium]
MKRILYIVALVGLIVVLAAVPSSAQPRPLPMPDAPPRLTNEWAVILEPGVDPNQTAAQLGMVNLGQVGSLENIYRFAYPADIRTARTDITAALNNAPQIAVAIQQQALERVLRGVEDNITDPLFGNQWHLRSSAQNGANVFPAWNAGYTGEGVVVASVDDGVWHANPDITPNYRADLSYDYVGNDTDPSAGGHGTAVAGVMAAAADGGQCGVGVAFDASISGIRLNLS